MDQSHRVRAEQGVGASGDLEVAGDVVGGLGGVHAGQGVPHRDPLVECGQHPQAQALAQGWLSDEQGGEGGA